MRTPHTSTYKGKRVLVILRDGSRFVAKYSDTKGHYVLFLDHRQVRKENLRVFSIYKNPT